MGLDINAALIQIGFDLFRDRARPPAAFVVGDMLDADDAALAALDGRVSIVHASNFWHLFSWAQQLAIAVRLVAFFSGGDGAVVYGRQVGTAKAGPPSRPGASFLHDQESFQRLWDQVGVLTGSRWKVEMEFVGERLAKIPGFGGDSRAARYGVYRVE